MPGPVISKIKEKLDEEDEGRGRILRESPILEDHRMRLREELDGKAGGCCGAMEAAEAIRQNRTEGQMYK